MRIGALACVYIGLWLLHGTYSLLSRERQQGLGRLPSTFFQAFHGPPAGINAKVCRTYDQRPIPRPLVQFPSHVARLEGSEVHLGKRLIRDWAGLGYLSTIVFVAANAAFRLHQHNIIGHKLQFNLHKHLPSFIIPASLLFLGMILTPCSIRPDPARTSFPSKPRRAEGHCSAKRRML